jgi:hypothetical protein
VSGRSTVLSEQALVSATIHLGFEVGSGAGVEIPVRHMAVTGQTQESGKTTTLEALIARSGLTALAFVTKRGESAFADGRRVDPYFRDRADWQFVDQLLEAQLREKNKFLRPWIMRICRHTRTLADVHREVRKALAKSSGFNEGIYTQLDAYLDLIVPEIESHELASKIELEPGLNVMDISDVGTPMQMLFVQSAIDWVNEHETNTVVIVPEAWEFIPEGKGSPVKASAVSLVRKGAGIGNYIWVDSQDMAGVDKVILRGCTVWLIGVQREANEIKRNLSNIPASLARPSAAAVATLERGQFYACHGKHAVKTYVQPAWMSSEVAEQVARGLLDAPKMGRQPNDREGTVKESEAQGLRDENRRLQGVVAELQRQLQTRADALVPPEDAPRARHRDNGHANSPESVRLTSLDDSLYQSIKQRILAEPAVLRALAQKPEIRVEVERPTIEAKPDSLQGRLALLIADGFFDAGVSGYAVQKEWARFAFNVSPGSLYPALEALTQLGFLEIEDPGGKKAKLYKAVDGMKVNVVDNGAKRR